jgi:hypothetical protein
MLLVMAVRAGLPSAVASLNWLYHEFEGGWIFDSLKDRAAYALLKLDPDTLPDTSNEPVPDMSSGGLKVVVVQGGLLVGGLVPGESFRIYNPSGQLILYGKAVTAEERVPLRKQGVYIVTAANGTAKAVY